MRAAGRDPGRAHRARPRGHARARGRAGRAARPDGRAGRAGRAGADRPGGRRGGLVVGRAAGLRGDGRLRAEHEHHDRRRCRPSTRRGTCPTTTTCTRARPWAPSTRTPPAWATAGTATGTAAGTAGRRRGAQPDFQRPSTPSQGVFSGVLDTLLPGGGGSRSNNRSSSSARGGNLLGSGGSSGNGGWFSGAYEGGGSGGSGSGGSGSGGSGSGGPAAGPSSAAGGSSSGAAAPKPGPSIGGMPPSDLQAAAAGHAAAVHQASRGPHRARGGRRRRRWRPGPHGAAPVRHGRDRLEPVVRARPTRRSSASVPAGGGISRKTSRSSSRWISSARSTSCRRP